jgi:hypothetical protein
VANIQPDENGLFHYSQIEAGPYRMVLSGMDLSGDYQTLEVDRIIDIPFTDGDWNLTLVGNITIGSVTPNYDQENPSLTISQIQSNCQWTYQLRVFMSEEDPGTFEEAMRFYSDEFLVADQYSEGWMDVVVPITEAGAYVGIEIISDLGDVQRVVPFWVPSSSDNSFFDRLDVRSEKTVFVRQGRPVVLRSEINSGEFGVLEWFDRNSKSLSGEGLLVTAYNADSSEVLFERAACRMPDGTARVFERPADGVVHFKLEVAEDGADGNFNLFLNVTGSPYATSIDADVDLLDFHSPYRWFKGSAPMGTSVFSAYESNPDERGVAYVLYDETHDAMLIDHVAPGSVETPRLDSFELDGNSIMHLFVMRSYWGDFDNQITFRLN